jgi:hypothetical protein
VGFCTETQTAPSTVLKILSLIICGIVPPIPFRFFPELLRGGGG